MASDLLHGCPDQGNRLESPSGADDAAVVGSNMWGEKNASVSSTTSEAMFAPSVLMPTVALLEELADGGPALEFAVGTGRVALPLSAREVVVRGVELSPPMAARLAEKPPGAAVRVTIGDMTAAHVEGDFKLVTWCGTP